MVWDGIVCDGMAWHGVGMRRGGVGWACGYGGVEWDGPVGMLGWSGMGLWVWRVGVGWDWVGAGFGGVRLGCLGVAILVPEGFFVTVPRHFVRVLPK